MNDEKVVAINAELLAKTIESLRLEVNDLRKKLEYKRPVVDTDAKEKLLLILGIASVCLEEESLSVNEVRDQINKAINLLNSLN